MQVAGVTLRAHRAVLAARCEALRAMLASDCIEGRTATVHVPDCTPEAFAAFLR